MKKKNVYPLFFLFNIVLLTSCSVGPDYVRPLAMIPTDYKEAPPEWKFATPQEGINRGVWWDVFNDPDLNALETQVNISNQNIQAACAQYQQAKALIAQARAGYFPTLTGSQSVTREKEATSSSVINSLPSPSSASSGANSSSGAFTNYNAALDATWAPDLWGGIRRSVEVQKRNAQASHAQLALTQLLAQASLAQYYFELRGLDEDQIILNNTVTHYQKLLDIVYNRYRAGTASRANILQAKSQLELAEAQAIDNGILRAQYEHAIAMLIGLPPASFSLPPRSGSVYHPIIPLECPSTLLERRPDIAQAERQMASANAQIGVAVAAYFPVLTLTGADGYNSVRLSRLFTEPSHFWSLGAQLVETLFDGGLRNANVDYAKALFDQSVATYRQTVLAAFQDVEDNLAALRILDDELLKLQESVITAKETLELTINTYRAGTAQLSDVLTAEITLYTAQKGANDTEYRRMVAAVGLIRALGGGWRLEDAGI